jgi:hypothetical protein
VEIVDDSVVVVDRGTVAAVIADRVMWHSWWPECDVTVVRNAGPDGMRWALRGALVGSTEVVIEPHGEGVLVHYALLADPTQPGSSDQPRALPDSPHGRRELEALRRRHLLAWKRTIWTMAIPAGR